MVRSAGDRRRGGRSDCRRHIGHGDLRGEQCGGATQNITITATDDALSETAESFTVTLGAITSTLSSQLSLKNGASSAQATIAASDPITVNISGPSKRGRG